jgi:hypothetical protein
MTAAFNSSFITAGSSLSSLCVRNVAEQFQQSCGGDVVGAADAQDPARELTLLGEFLGFGAADAQGAGSGCQVHHRGQGVELVTG